MTGSSEPAQSAGLAREGLVVLYVCTGNICRSAYLELRSRALAPRVCFGSAGTAAVVGAGIAPEMSDEMVGRGQGLPAFRARQLTDGHLAAADLVLTAAGHHRAWILERRPSDVTKVYAVGQFARSLARIDPSLRGRPAVAAVSRIRLAGHPDDDVADPYGQGVAAAQACAARLEELLAAILPRLW